MRKILTATLERIAKQDPKMVFLTGDLGFRVFEPLEAPLGKRFINAGIAEANMMSVAAGIAYAGYTPWVYSIAPFLILKTAEQLRNEVVQRGMPVKLVGMGGGFSYGVMGNTHHLLEDIALLSAMNSGVRIGIPAFDEDVAGMTEAFHQLSTPTYIRLNQPITANIKLPEYAPTRQLIQGDEVVIVALGPVVNQALEAHKQVTKKDNVGIWVVSELPLTIPEELTQQITKAKHLLIIEEAAEHGGLGEQLTMKLLYKNITLPKIHHVFGRLQPDHLYGSQTFHQKDSGLDAASLIRTLQGLLE